MAPDRGRISAQVRTDPAAVGVTYNGRIEVSIRDGALEVADRGPAIPASNLERVFDRLWRGDRARSGDGAHCGIGLALSRSLCGTLSLSLSAHNTKDGSVIFSADGRSDHR
jgi:signal transduction histidine kinase